MAITLVDGATQVYETDVATGPVTAFVLPVPSSGGALAEGDVLVAQISWDTATNVAISRTLPSGWTSQSGGVFVSAVSATSNVQMEVLSHVVTAGEAGTTPTWTLTTSSAFDAGIAVARFRGVDTADLLSVSAPAAGYSVAHYTAVTGAKVAPLVTVDTANSMLVTGSMHRSNSTTISSVDTGYTIAASVSAQAAGRAGGLAYKAQAATGDSTTATWNTSTTNIGSVWQTALKPASTAAPGRLMDRWNGSSLVRQSVQRWNGSALATQTIEK